jgi:hypothetical protein
MDLLVGPLPEEYCMYFKILAIIALVWIVVISCKLMYGLFYKTKQDTGLMIGTLCVYVIMYLQNRILNNICTKTL